MAKKPDMTVVKDFLFRYGERIGLFTCAGVALLLLIMGFTGAAGPGTATGEPWEVTLKKAQSPINSKLNQPVDSDAVEKRRKEFTVEKIDWRLVDSRMTPGAYINGGEKFEIGRNNPVVFNPLAGDQNFQMDYIQRGYVGYEVQNKKILTVADAGAGAAGPGNLGGPKGPGGLGNVGGAQGSAGGGLPLAHVLKPRHMLVVTGLYPMKKQVDEYVKALRLRDASELIAAKEMPIVLGINVARQVFGPDGKPLTKEPQLYIYYDIRKKNLYVDPLLNKELAEAIIDEDNPRKYKTFVHEGLVTPLPKLPEGVYYPPVRIQTEFMNLKDLVADASDPAAPGPQGGLPGGLGKPGIGMPNQKGGSGKPPPILPGGSGAKGPMNPAGGGNDPEATPDIPTKPVPLTELAKTDKELYKRLDALSINIFHPFGQFPDPSDSGASTVERFGFVVWNSGGAPAVGPGGGGPGPAPGGPGLGGPGPGGLGKVGSGAKGLGPAGLPKPGGGADPAGPAAAPAAGAAINDAIVRFVDLDVKPGYRYRYYIQVRFHNPNYGKKHEVAQQLFADMKELVADEDWTPTPEVAIPETYHLFAVDQFYNVDFMGEKNQQDIKKKMGQKEFKPADNDHAVVQIHRWFGRTESGYRVGDWAIVERLRVRKGEKIGNQEMVVEIPTWSDGKGAFEMRHTTPPAGKGKAAKLLPGVPLDFVPTVLAPDGKRREPIEPILVDFEGGRKAYAPLLGSAAPFDESGLDVLVLNAEGRLIVRNSRADIDAKIDADRATETTRQAQVEAWRKRNQEAISASSGGGNAMPGGAPPILK